MGECEKEKDRVTRKVAGMRKKDFGTTERGLSNWSDINETAQIDGAKHYIHWSNLDEVYELICKWAF